MDTIWNEVMIGRLVEMHNSGMSAGQMATAFGSCVTRNSVLSKTKRLMANHPELFIHIKNPAATRQQLPVIKLAPKPKPVLVKDLSAPEPLGAINDFPDRERTTCRYIHGDPSQGEWRACGHSGYPYCQFHHQKCITPFREGARISDSDRARVAQVNNRAGSQRIFG